MIALKSGDWAVFRVRPFEFRCGKVERLFGPSVKIVGTKKGAPRSSAVFAGSEAECRELHLKLSAYGETARETIRDLYADADVFVRNMAERKPV